MFCSSVNMRTQRSSTPAPAFRYSLSFGNSLSIFLIVEISANSFSSRRDIQHTTPCFWRQASKNSRNSHILSCHQKKKVHFQQLRQHNSPYGHRVTWKNEPISTKKNVLLKMVLLLIHLRSLVWSPARSHKQLWQHKCGAIGGGGREQEILKACSQEHAM